MRRREFIAGLGGAAAWPVAARAQQRVLRVGWLDQLPERDPGASAEDIAFRHGMEEFGWTIGRNLTVDVADGAPDALASVPVAAVAKFHCFMRAGRGTGRNGGPADGARLQQHFDFHCRVAPGVEDLPPD